MSCFLFDFFFASVIDSGTRVASFLLSEPLWRWNSSAHEVGYNRNKGHGSM
jgi:hypothetical protein